MKTIRLKTRDRATVSTVVCRDRVLEEALPKALEPYRERGVLVFTDETVFRLYKEKLEKYLPWARVHAMPAGEENKGAESLFSLLEAMAKAGLHRGSVLVALGGGVVGDIGGLAAGLYMRGIACIQVPTTLLAQVDASVGGKTAIDFCGVKNLVGLFKQPETVFADPAFFATLPPREIRSGLGEIIKHAALCAPLFDKLSAHEKNLTNLNFLAQIVPENIAFKVHTVAQDTLEKGLRKCLNLGHTVAHAIELSGADLSHGECVLIGIVYEAEFAKRHCVCDENYLNTLQALCLAVLGSIPKVDIGRAAALSRLDKKNKDAENITLVVPVKKGEYKILELPLATYEEQLEEIQRILW
ncbi:MAG: 3-dehydroquinate synthase [Clostridia bacterium]|nr:3-dehydroquinate synthase [Clostridia bacterium]